MENIKLLKSHKILFDTYRHQIRIQRLISNSYSLAITQINKNQSLIYLFFGYIPNILTNFNSTQYLDKF